MREFHIAGDVAARGLYRLIARQVKAAIDPVLFYSQAGQEVKPKSGSKWSLAGLCPFHEDACAGSFYIHTESGAFKCFSCDVKGGDIISFTMKKYGLPFRAALEMIRKGGVL
jgi:DNA primase